MNRELCVYVEFLTEDLREKIRQTAEETGFTPHFFDLEEFDAARAALQHCEVLYAHSPELLRTAPASLQWYACAFAGVDPYCKDDGIFQNPKCLLTNSNVYGVTIAEHVIMVTLMLLRQMPVYQEIMRNRGWSNQLPIRSIHGGRFTVLGTGDIGGHIAQNLQALGAKRVIGLCRSGRAEGSCWNSVFPISALEQILPETDVLIMALPETAETIGILTRQRISLLPKGAYVVNVGRGTAIDQEALMDALNSEHLAGAALDVMMPEPLPQDHPLWETKHLLLTPHVSGNMTLDYTRQVNVERFCENLRRYAIGKPLLGLIDRSRGY